MLFLNWGKIKVCSSAYNEGGGGIKSEEETETAVSKGSSSPSGSD